MVDSAQLISNSSLSKRFGLGGGHLGRGKGLSFRVIYIAVFLFLLLYITTIRLLEFGLDQEFQERANRAAHVTQLDEPVASQIQRAMTVAIEKSAWVTIGGVRVTTLVLASDGITWLYVHGHIGPQPEGLPPTGVLRQAVELLPASSDVSVTVPHNSLLANAVLIFYASFLLSGLYQYNRINQRRYTRQMNNAVTLRDEARHRASEIEGELQQARRQLEGVEPTEKALGAEISTLQIEREGLQKQLGSLAAREEELRGSADQAIELSQEVQALEDLLEEAASDISSKDEEIRELGQNLKKASRGSGGPSGKGSDLLARRLRTLYKTLEIDDNAINKIIALRDEGMKLKAEEGLKRLAEESDNVAVRRKVGGLPNYLHIFELGFAGKGRIYYTRGKQRRFRILTVGAKNSQDQDMDFPRRLGRDEMA